MHFKGFCWEASWIPEESPQSLSTSWDSPLIWSLDVGPFVNHVSVAAKFDRIK